MPKYERGNNVKNIRTYVLGLIYRNGFSSVRVPSSIELAEAFHVTRRTARMALEGLIAEGFLISRKGVGTFTNPKTGFKLEKTQQNPLIGLAYSDGSFFYYDLNNGILFAELMKQLLRSGSNVYPMVHLPVSPEQFRNDVENAHLDALILCAPRLTPEYRRMFGALPCPVITVQNELPGHDFIGFDFQKAAEELFSLAVREKRRKILAIRSTPSGNVFMPPLQALAAAGKADLEVTERAVTAETYARILREFFSDPQKTPDILIAGWRSLPVLKQLSSEFAVTPERCRIVFDCEPVTPGDFPCMVCSPPETEAAAKVIAILQRRLAEPELAPQREFVFVSNRWSPEK